MRWDNTHQTSEPNAWGKHSLKHTIDKHELNLLRNNN